MDQNKRKFVKYLAVVAVILMVSASYYFISRPDPIVFVEDGDLQITVNLDQTFISNDTTSITGNISIRNMAGSYRYIRLDPNHYNFVLINNSIIFTQSKGLINAIYENIKLESNEEYVLHFYVSKTQRFSNKTYGFTNISKPGAYGLYFSFYQYPNDCVTNSDFVYFEIMK